MKDQEENPLVELQSEQKVDDAQLAQNGWQTRSVLNNPFHPIAFFNSSEHEIIGENLELPFSNGRKENSTSFVFNLQNGVKLRFGEIIALAGDFYGGRP
jgi:hypothetical protein